MTLGQVFTAKKVVNQPIVYEGFELDSVEFRSCALAQFEQPLQTVVREGSARNCKVSSCSVHGVKFENVDVENISFSKPMEFAACAFQHVSLKGKIGQFITTPPHYSLNEVVKAAFNSALVDFYKDVDWALDIAAAQFVDATIYMIPGNLVRRDPETQFILRRSSFESISRDSLPPMARIYFDRFEATPFDSYVEIAPTRSKSFKMIYETLAELKSSGLAE